MPVDDVIGTIALVLAGGLGARVVAALTRLPALLLLVCAGVLLGPSGLELVHVPLASPAAQLLLTLGVSFILFHGGIQLAFSVLRRTLPSLLLLAIPGVVLTAAIVGTAAAIAFDVPILTGLLVGAVLAPTDPAILIPLFDRLHLRRKVVQTLIAESALNDPTGAVLALALAAAAAGAAESLTSLAVDFVLDVGLSTAIGIGFGIALSLVVSSRRFGVWRDSAALAVAAVVAASFVSIDFAGGSGFLGAFLAGLIVNNMDELRLAMHSRSEEEVRVFARVVSDLVAIFVFVILGANLPLDALASDFVPALVVVATLVLVARPLVVAACLLPDRRARWTRNELVFVAWTRETGVVPAALAGILVGLGVEGAEHVTVAVALAIVVTLGLQTSTKPWLARRLGLLDSDAAPAAPGASR